MCAYGRVIMRKQLVFFIVFLQMLFGSSALVYAKQPLYVELDKPLLANYISDDPNTLKYVRVKVTFRLLKDEDPNKEKEHQQKVKEHLPLLRDAMMQILRTKSRAQIINSKKAIIAQCLARVNELLVQETQSKRIAEVIFNTYLYDG